MKVYIIGYMGAGKSKFGADIATRLGFTFLDMDDIFEEKYHISVGDFFSKYGENAFRLIEKTILENTSELDNTVISTGGGTPCFYDNMDFILKNGISLYLKQEVHILSDRLRIMKRKRPLLNDIKDEDLEFFIKDHLEKREEFYKRSNLIADGSRMDIDEITACIENSDFS